jgi:hypothetical protein
MGLSVNSKVRCVASDCSPHPMAAVTAQEMTTVRKKFCMAQSLILLLSSKPVTVCSIDGLSQSMKVMRPSG